MPGQLIRNNVAQLVEPEIGDGLQHFTLARDRVGQDDVEGGKAIAGDDEQLFVVDGVDVADLALVMRGRLVMVDSKSGAVTIGFPK